MALSSVVGSLRAAVSSKVWMSTSRWLMVTSPPSNDVGGVGDVVLVAWRRCVIGHFAPGVPPAWLVLSQDVILAVAQPLETKVTALVALVIPVPSCKGVFLTTCRVRVL